MEGVRRMEQAMSLLELQQFLGAELRKVWDSEKAPRETQTKILDTASVISSLAKQMINNADVILRTEKLVGEDKLRQSAIVKGKRKNVNSKCKQRNYLYPDP